MMRFLPDVFTDTFEDMWKDPFFTKSNSCMKTDVRELDGNYLLDMELCHQVGVNPVFLQYFRHGIIKRFQRRPAPMEKVVAPGM